MKQLSVVLVAAILILCSGCRPVMAAGGVYVDDITIINNGATVFSANMDSGKLDGWTSLSDAVLTCEEPDKPPCALHLNKHGKLLAKASHKVSLNNVGLLELSFRIMLTPPQEQARWASKERCAFYANLYSGSSKCRIGAAIVLEPDAKAARVGTVSNSPNRNALDARYILQPVRWSTISVRLDPVASQCSVFLDGDYITRMYYDPRYLASVNEIGFETGFGDQVNPTK